MYQTNISVMDVFEDEPFERLISFLFMYIPMEGVAGHQSKSLRNNSRDSNISGPLGLLSPSAGRPRPRASRWSRRPSVPVDPSR